MKIVWASENLKVQELENEVKKLREEVKELKEFHPSRIASDQLITLRQAITSATEQEVERKLADVMEDVISEVVDRALLKTRKDVADDLVKILLEKAFLSDERRAK